jgi:hypothetical protein
MLPSVSHKIFQYDVTPDFQKSQVHFASDYVAERVFKHIFEQEESNLLHFMKYSKSELTLSLMHRLVMSTKAQRICSIAKPHFARYPVESAHLCDTDLDQPYSLHFWINLAPSTNFSLFDWAVLTRELREDLHQNDFDYELVDIKTTRNGEYGWECPLIQILPEHPEESQ